MATPSIHAARSGKPRAFKFEIRINGFTAGRVGHSFGGVKCVSFPCNKADTAGLGKCGLGRGKLRWRFTYHVQ